MVRPKLWFINLKNIPVRKVLIIFVVFLIFIGFVFVFFGKNQKKSDIQNPENLEMSSKDKKLVDRVEELIQLPSETPSIATVSDVDKLQDQDFFKKAKNGDKILIYSKKAILYRPSSHKIIDVSLVIIPTPTPIVVQYGGEVEKPAENITSTP